MAEAVVAAAEAAERGGRSGALRLGDDLTPQQRHAVLQAEALHGSPLGTVMKGVSGSGLLSEMQHRRTRIQRQRVRQRDSSRSSLSGGRLVPVPRPLC